MILADHFLPTTPEELDGKTPDFVYVCGDAYVDHPSFGAALITRVLEKHGFTCAMLCQPEFRSADEFKKFGKPRLGFLVSAGNIDSMVAHYTAAKNAAARTITPQALRQDFDPTELPSSIATASEKPTVISRFS